jgi:hypothetical protein
MLTAQGLTLSSGFMNTFSLGGSGVGSGVGLSVASGLAEAVGEADSVGVAVADGDAVGSGVSSAFFLHEVIPTTRMRAKTNARIFFICSS